MHGRASTALSSLMGRLEVENHILWSVMVLTKVLFSCYLFPFV